MRKNSCIGWGNYLLLFLRRDRYNYPRFNDMARVDQSARPDRITTTDTASWQSECMVWAKNGEIFEVHGVRHQHLPFFQELSAAYKLKFRFSMADSCITFLPE